MITKYVMRNLRRRKVRTILMVLSLIVGVGTLTALNATIESYRRYYAASVSGEVGDFDLVISRPDTATDRFLNVADIAPLIEAVPGVESVAPRINAIVSVRGPEKDGDKPFVALDPATDTFGEIKVTDGEYDLSVGDDGLPGAIVLQETADVLDLEVGDPIEVLYSPPKSRLTGLPPDETASSRRARATWVVRGIGTQRGATGQSANEGVVVDIDAARDRFGLGPVSERLVVRFDPALYDSSDPQRSSFDARDVAYLVRDTLGVDQFDYLMPRPRAIIDGASQFIFFQSLVAMYGVLTLGVVGLLIRTLVMTNVQEQTRDMAVLRILGAPRRHLFNIVMAEVALIGIVGVGLGILVGQLINNLAIVPFMEQQAGGMSAEVPLISLSTIVLAVAVSGAVLGISTLTPARKASNTKVTHAINPGIAQGIGLDDLEKLRERRTDIRITGVGMAILIYPALLFFIFPLAFDFGILWILAGLIFAAFLALIIGAALLFYLVILPMERGLLWFIDRIAARAGYFIRRTVLRSKERNTLISLMIVISATLPTFLSTTLALEVANTENDRRLMGGAPFRINAPRQTSSQQLIQPEAATEGVFDPELLETVRSDPDFAHAAALSTRFSTRTLDGVGLRDVSVRAAGVDEDLARVMYREAYEFVEGDESALARIVDEPGTAIIGAGLSTYLDRHVGDEIVLDGEGRDHQEVVEVVGVANRIGGVGTFTAKQTQIWTGGSTVLTGMDTWRQLTTDPLDGSPDPNEKVSRLLLARHRDGVDESELTTNLRLRYATEHSLRITSTAEQVETVQREARTGQIFLLVLTALTSVLAVFGVFAVIYVSIYGRRGEIGMLKAIGSPGRHLTAVFVGEAMVMTLSATLTGVTAGVLLGYVVRISNSFQMEAPTTFAFDKVVVPSMLLLMIFSSLISAVVATHAYRRKKAIEILRTL